MAVQWAQEACDRYTDPESGARIISMTAGALISNNVYGEQPYTSPDGNRIAILRRHDWSFDTSSALLVGDLQRLRVGLIERSGVISVCNNAWSGQLHYATERGDFVRLDLTTLEKKVYSFSQDAELLRGGASVSPDQRYVLYSELRPGPTMGIVVLDLKEQTRQVIFEHPEIINPHLQFNPITGKEILVQHNRGSKMAADGTVTQFIGPTGTTLFVIDREGKNLRPLPVGEPHTFGATGHEAFVANTGKVVFTVGWDANWKLDPRWPQGNLFTARPGDAKPTVFVAPEHRFNHVCALALRRYFVADSYPGGTLFDKNNVLQSVCLVIGNVETGKYRNIVKNTMASGGGSQCTHTHPYLTADNRWVVFNSDPHFGVPQVWAAEIPKGFLASLD